MARGRLVSKDSSIDPALNSISVDAQLLYLLTLPHLDRDGLVDGRPLVLVAMAAPLRTELRDRAPALINEWVEAGLVIRYDWPDGFVLFFTGFRRHNHLPKYYKETASRYPPPPGYIRSEYGLVPDDPNLAATLAASFDARSNYHQALLCPDNVRTMSEHCPPEVEGQEEVEGQDQAKENIAAAADISGHGLISNDRVDLARETTRSLAAWCKLRIDELFGYGVWNGLDDYLASLPAGELKTLAGWVWKAHERPNFVDKTGEPYGPGFYRRMVATGQRAGLSPVERAGLHAVLEEYSDD